MAPLDLTNARPAPVSMRDDAVLYAVNDIYASVQGEGTHTGVPMVILRLHGCPVACAFCDTKETWTLNSSHEYLASDELAWRGTNANWTMMDASDIAHRCRQEAPSVRWILLTGGEPAQQPLEQLVAALHAQGFKVALETSGTATGFVSKVGIDHVCVSPKVGMPGRRVIQPAAIAAADEIKWLIGKRSDLDQLEAFLIEYGIDESAQSISLQPLSTNVAATKLCLDYAIKRGFRVSIQVHKYLGAR